MTLNATEEITAAYRLLLGRDPDETGLQTYLDAKLAPEAMARSIMLSPEFRARQTAVKVVSVYGLEFVVPATEAMYDGDYEPAVFQALMSRMRPGVTFLDVGANIGLFTVHAAKRGATVISVEPKPSNTRLLLENARRNDVSVELHPLGASRESGYAVLQLSENANAGIRQLEATSLGDEVIATQKLDTIVGERLINVLKIDIEGHEYAAMLGANSILSQSQPTIITEYSDEFQRLGSGVDGMQYLKLMESYGYRFSLLGENGIVAIKVEDIDSEWKNAPTHVDLLLER